mmetsp:Transcript_75183/g.141830  ORF Transcript_75183/g.141830 Transcript_75183/m.141830 type:complete len:216 (-) Transcript_75183:360-1007(-)
MNCSLLVSGDLSLLSNFGEEFADEPSALLGAVAIDMPPILTLRRSDKDLRSGFLCSDNDLRGCAAGESFTGDSSLLHSPDAWTSNTAVCGTAVACLSLTNAARDDGFTCKASPWSPDSLTTDAEACETTLASLSFLDCEGDELLTADASSDTPDPLTTDAEACDTRPASSPRTAQVVPTAWLSEVSNGTASESTASKVAPLVMPSSETVLLSPNG